MKCNKGPAGDTPCFYDQQLAFYQRGSRKAPMGRLASVFGLKNVKPRCFAIVNLERVKLSICTPKKDPIRVNRGGSAGAVATLPV